MPAAFESIQTASPSSGTSEVTFSNLQSTTQYDHFMMSCYFQASTGSGGSNVEMRLNGAQSADYNYLRTMVDGGSISTSANQNATFIDIADIGSNYGAAIVWIIGARTGEYKNVYSEGAPDGAQRSKFNFGQYQSTNNITSITFYLGDGRPMSSNTRIALYGIKGA